MKRVTQKLTAMFLLTALLSVTAAPASAAAFVPQIAGVWEITGTPDPGGCGPSEPFTNLTTVTVGGQITNVDPALGTFVGQAYRLGKKTYATGFFGYISPAPNVTLNLEVQGTLELVNPGEAAGRFRSIITDPSGVPQCVYEGTIEGTRLVPMPY